jgi:hypothetical protein
MATIGSLSKTAARRSRTISFYFSLFQALTKRPLRTFSPKFHQVFLGGKLYCDPPHELGNGATIGHAEPLVAVTRLSVATTKLSGVILIFPLIFVDCLQMGAH